MEYPVHLDLRESIDTETYNIDNCYVIGSWDNWKHPHPISQILYLYLKPQMYQFKCFHFQNDEKEWFLLPYSFYPTIIDTESQQVNNTLLVKLNDDSYSFEYDVYQNVGKFSTYSFVGQVYINGELSYDGELPNGNAIHYRDDDTMEYSGDTYEYLRHGKGLYLYKNGDKYDGEWYYNCRHGKGLLTCSNGDTYDGEWENDVFHGTGTYVTETYKYIGEFETGFKSGKGIITYKNGDIYEGACELDLPNGKGKMIYGNGDIYEGEWKDGKRSGYGIMKYVNQPDPFFKVGEYIGNWLDDKKHGHGTYNMSDLKYIGDFKYDMLNGNVYIYRKDNTLTPVYNGSMMNNMYHGNGIEYKELSDDSFIRFSGKFEYNMFVNGSVSKLVSYGYELMYDGDFVNNSLTNGKIYEKGKMIYQGDLKNGLRHGCGKEYKEFVLLYDGQWFNDKKHGFGTSYKNNKIHHNGIWKNGEEHNGPNDIYIFILTILFIILYFKF